MRSAGKRWRLLLNWFYACLGPTLLSAAENHRPAVLLRPLESFASFLLALDHTSAFCSGLHRGDSIDVRVRNQRSQDRRRPVTLMMDTFSEFSSAGATSGVSFPLIDQVPTLLPAVGVLAAYLLIEKLPRGWISEDAPLEARQSTVPNAGRGLFVTAPLPKGYVIGAFPGRLRSLPDYRAKIKQHPETSAYAWTLNTGRVLDPTDDEGKLPEKLEWIPGIGSGVPTTLALINEPGRGGDTNLNVEEDSEEVRFVTWREVAEGEELFIDYGQNYDRSGYGYAMTDELRKVF